MKNGISFIVKNSIGVFCFCVVVFITMWISNQSFVGETGLHTDKPGQVTGNTGPVTLQNAITQSILFQKPVVLHRMDLYLADNQPVFTMPKIKVQIMDLSQKVLYEKKIRVSRLQGKRRLSLDLKGVSFRSNEQYYLCLNGTGEDDTLQGPAFATMQQSSPFTELTFYTETDERRDPEALMLQCQYDVMPMGWGYYVGYLVILLGILAFVNLRKGVVRIRLVSALSGLWFLFFAGFLFAVCVDNNIENIRNYSSKAALSVFFLGLIVMAGICWRHRMRERGRIEVMRTQKLKRWFCLHSTGVLGAYFLILFVLQCLISFQIFQKVGWDANATWDAASWWLTHEDPVMGEYLLCYPNNIGFTLFLYIIRFPVKGEILAFQYWIVVMVNILLVDLGIFLCWYLAKKLLGGTGAAISLVIITLLFGFSGYLAAPYTDTVTFFFPILVMVLYQKMRESEHMAVKCLRSFFIGIVVILGYFLKPQCVIVLLGILIVEGISMCKRLRAGEIRGSYWRRKSALALCLAAGVCLGNFSVTALRDQIVKGYTREEAVPVVHFAMMGLGEYPQWAVPGIYKGTDVKYTLSFEKKEDKKRACIERIGFRLRNYGFAGFMKHMYRKTTAILGDGAFFWQVEAGGYGFWREDLQPVDSGFRHQVREIYYGKYGNYDNTKFRCMRGVLTGIWFLMLLFIAVPVRRDHPQAKSLSIVALSAFGCLLFTMLFEARSRYLINYLPLFTITAAAGILRLRDRFYKPM